MDEAEAFLVVLGFLGIAFCVTFCVIHCRPLNDNEISQLADKRRSQDIAAYFQFTGTFVPAEFDLKKNLKSDGRLYEIDKNLSEFPSYVASLLKYKKHEWIIIGFEKDRRVISMWVNKGFDCSSAASGLSINGAADIAERKNIKSILFFHNHPNQNPGRYSCTKPSETDLKTARRWSEVLRPQGINLIEFVCERGRHYQYFCECSDLFLPMKAFRLKIAQINGSSRWENFSLHWERMFA